MHWLFRGTKCDLWFLFVLMQLLLSCSGSDDSERLPSSERQGGYLTGTVKDSRGNALPGVSIIVDNTVFANTYATTSTNEKGEYHVRVSDLGVWVAYAKHTFRYEGQDYEVYLRPDISEGFVGEDGAVRNFVWEMTGTKPLPLSGYFGGSVEIVKGVGSTIYDPENIVFTFTPTAPLVDGSSGEVFSKRCDSNSMIEDIPMGKYRITAVYHSDGGILPLTLSDFFTQGEFVSELELVFSPRTHLCDNCMIIQYQ